MYTVSVGRREHVYIIKSCTEYTVIHAVRYTNITKAARITKTRGETKYASLNINIRDGNYGDTAFRTVFGRSGTEHAGCSLDAMDDAFRKLNDGDERHPPSSQEGDALAPERVYTTVTPTPLRTTFISRRQKRSTTISVRKRTPTSRSTTSNWPDRYNTIRWTPTTPG